jgi:hypothetical protein
VLTATSISAIVERELAQIDDPGLVECLRPLLVSPFAVERDWNYGAPDETVTCWTVLVHAPSNTVIAYSEQGFGPSFPWGIVSLSGKDMSCGMDCQWFESLESAFRESRGYGLTPHT